MNYWYLALILALIIIGGVVYYFVSSSEKSYDLDKILTDSTDKSKDLEQKEDEQIKRKDEKEEKEEEKTPEKIDKEENREPENPMLSRFAASLKKHPILKAHKDRADSCLKLKAEGMNCDLKNCASHLSKFVPWGIALLSADKKQSSYLKIVEDLIKTIDAELDTISFNGATFPFNQSWYDVAVLLTRMLAMYEILGSDDKVKAICHKRILQITPEINESFGVRRTGIELVWIAVPRLITTILFVKDVYDAEIGSKCDALRAFMRDGVNVYDRSPKDFADGFYQDGSFIYSKAATYKPLIDLQTFYIEILKVLEFPTGIEDRVKGICNSMLHPDMDFVPFRLFDSEPTVTYQQAIVKYWPEFEKKTDYKTQIFPVIGLGVFKSSNLLFSVRVQRAKIEAFKSDDKNIKFALGCIQMRKLYMKEANYEKFSEGYMTSQELKKQPGVISFDGDDDLTLVNSEVDSNVRSHFVNVTHSHIGHFEVKDHGSVLYWMQKYKFNYDKIDISIMEGGVCTKDGFVMFHRVTNNSEGPLKIQVEDQEIDSRITYRYNDNSDLKLEDGRFTIKKEATAVITVQHVMSYYSKLKKIIYQDDEISIKFVLGEKTFIVKSDGDFSVVISDTEGPLIASGYSIWKKTYNYNYNGKQVTFEYNPATKMFEKN